MAEEVTMTDPSEQANVDTEAIFSKYDDMFMAVAAVTARKSKFDHKVGAVLVKDRKIVGYGYNGTPRNRPARGDDTDVELDAHTNVIQFSTATEVKGATMYATHWPSKEGAARIVQSAINRIYVLGKPDAPLTPAEKLAKKILGDGAIGLGKVEMEPLTPMPTQFTINFDDIIAKRARLAMQPQVPPCLRCGHLTDDILRQCLHNLQ